MTSKQPVCLLICFLLSSFSLVDLVFKEGGDFQGGCCVCFMFMIVTCMSFVFHRFTTNPRAQMGFPILLLLGLVVAALFLIFLVCVISICCVNLCCPSESVHPYNQRSYVIGQSPYVIGQREGDFV